eukprot:3647376-Prymnesium_polylepis.2
MGKPNQLPMFSLGGGVSLICWSGKLSPLGELAASGGGKKPAKAPKLTPATQRLVDAVAAFAPKDKQEARKATFKVAAPLAPAQRDTSVLSWDGDCGMVDIIPPDNVPPLGLERPCPRLALAVD